MKLLSRRITNDLRRTVYRLPHAVFRFPITVLLTVLLLAVALPTLAQDAESKVSDDEVNEVAHEVYCPVCESTPLDVCQTQACADWRELIRDKLAQGESKEDIFNYFANQYGDRVLATPPVRGINLLVWGWPIVAVVAGAFIFIRYMRTLRHDADPDMVTTTGNTVAAEELPAPDDYAARIEREL